MILAKQIAQFTGRLRFLLLFPAAPSQYLLGVLGKPLQGTSLCLQRSLTPHSLVTTPCKKQIKQKLQT